MNPTDASRSRRLVVIVTAAALVLVLVGVDVYGLVTGPRTSDPPPATSSAPSGPVAPGGDPRELAPIPETDDPEEFARSVAEALFAWDTASGLMPLDYTSVLLEVADPTGVEQAGLASDIAGYLPTRESWTELRKYSTTQHLEITNVFVPEAWAEAVEQAQPGQLQPGTTAYTIEGIRHRAGVWNDEPTTSAHEVAFTIFLTCPPDGDPCHLLRLSIRDQPLH
ncbi:hypothetical protein [Mycetocola reblochoni]|uniref:hypothetical protein n=1 Tax=Mycetocola reblochoni TaxID=331618 RepID=UPI003F9978AA